MINKKNSILFFLGMSVVAGYYYFSAVDSSMVAMQNSAIRPYNQADHKAFIKKQFKENWYWLISSFDYNIEHMLDTRSPNNYEPRYKGKMDIVVLHQEGQPVGFGTYYMRSSSHGEILFIAVDKAFRGKRYAQQLVLYCLEQLKKKGAKVVRLATRVENKGARKLYNRLGFPELDESQGFVHYRQEL